MNSVCILVRVFSGAPEEKIIPHTRHKTQKHYNTAPRQDFELKKKKKSTRGAWLHKLCSVISCLIANDVMLSLKTHLCIDRPYP